MGCGESKHAVAIDNTITKSMSRRSRKQGNKETAQKSRNETGNVVSDSSISKVAEVSKKIDEKEGGKEKDVSVGAGGKGESEAADVVSVKDDSKREKVEEVKDDEEEREKAADVVVVQEKKEEIKNVEVEKEIKNVEVEKEKIVEVKADLQELENAAAIEERKDEIKKDEVKADQEEREKAAPAAVVVVQEEKEEIKNEGVEIEKIEEVKADVEEQENAAAVELVEKKDEIKKEEEVKADTEEVVSQEVAGDSSTIEEKISEVENEGKGNEGKEEGLKVDESKELDTEASAEEKTPANQNEEAIAAAPAADVKGN